MRNQLVKFSLVIGLGLVVTACSHPKKPVGEDYWQRVESHSALHLTGPKAQQRLEQDIATCVNEVKELVELSAIRETTPPATHHEYQKALDKDDELSHWETPSHRGDLMVDHTDYHDFESCMRHGGWERVNYVRPQIKHKSRHNYKVTQNTRKYGPGWKEEVAKKKAEAQSNYDGLNK